MGERAWRSAAVCRVEDPELFFPVGESGPAVAQVAAAKAVCARCPVLARCREFALVAIPEGVAGGLTAQERRGLARDRRRRAAASTRAGVVGRLPAGVDRRVVESLMAGNRVSGALAVELALAAVQLHLAGHKTGWIAARLGVSNRRVYRWLERHRAGKPLIQPRGRQGRVPA